MRPSAIVRKLRDDGFMISANDGYIDIAPSGKITAEIAAMIKTNKAELIQVVNGH